MDYFPSGTFIIFLIKCVRNIWTTYKVLVTQGSCYVKVVDRFVDLLTSLKLGLTSRMPTLGQDIGLPPSTKAQLTAHLQTIVLIRLHNYALVLYMRKKNISISHKISDFVYNCVQWVIKSQDQLRTLFWDCIKVGILKSIVLNNLMFKLLWLHHQKRLII